MCSDHSSDEALSPSSSIPPPLSHGQQQQPVPSPELQFQQFQQEAFRLALQQQQQQQQQHHYHHHRRRQRHIQQQQQQHEDQLHRFGSATEGFPGRNQVPGTQQLYPGGAAPSQSRHGSIQSIQSNESVQLQSLMAAQQQQRQGFVESQEDQNSGDGDGSAPSSEPSMDHIMSRGQQMQHHDQVQQQQQQLMSRRRPQALGVNIGSGGGYGSGLTSYTVPLAPRAIAMDDENSPISHGEVSFLAQSQQFGQFQAQHYQSQAQNRNAQQQPLLTSPHQQQEPRSHLAPNHPPPPGLGNVRRSFSSASHQQPQQSPSSRGGGSTRSHHIHQPFSTHQAQVQAARVQAQAQASQAQSQLGHTVSGPHPPLLPPDVGDSQSFGVTGLAPLPHASHPSGILHADTFGVQSHHRHSFSHHPQQDQSQPHHAFAPHQGQLASETHIHPPQVPHGFGDHSHNPSSLLVLPTSTALPLAYDPSASSFMSAQVAALNTHQFGEVMVSPHEGVGSISDMVITRDTGLAAGDSPEEGSSAMAGSHKRARPGDEDSPTNEEEEKKRTRGRPRLDTKDETAADRRRTQIRLAQRAYRNRKENAIQTLEKKVSELKETNEEMSNAFMKLHDFAISRGLLDAAPEFGRELRSTTEKFLSLARRSNEEANKDDEGANENQDNSPDVEVRRQSDPTSWSQPGSDSSDGITTTTATTTSILLGGIIVTHEDNPTATATTTCAAAAAAADSTTGAEYEVITQPSMENASFPYGTSAGAATGARGGCPNGVLSPFGSAMLPPPETFAHNEVTFGRRLQRTTLEQAISLVDAPGIHPEQFGRVFGFCLLFENRDKIRQRLTNSISVNTNETLHNWRFPFLQLGGAGTFLPQWHSADRTLNLGTGRGPVGNEGIASPMKPQNSNGFSTGPFDPAIMGTRDKRLGTGHRINLPGYEGDFFDADEVEEYLRMRNVVIPPHAEYVTVEVDLNSFPGEVGTVPHWTDIDEFGKPTVHLANSASFYDNTVAQTSTATTTAAGVSDVFSSMPSLVRGTSLAPNGRAYAAGGLSIDKLLLPPETSIPDYGLGLTSADASATVTSSEFPSPYYFNTNSNHLPAAELLSSKAIPNPRRVVTINVSVFINELISHAVCLGRSPGYKPMDVNNAFWVAAQD
ncbi:hypothetical protein MKZ38_010605 [Zalerion maritima]|uniref:BZIP domain-containing protein n=1 Tax=Zalerion maritima TaxID=339359 RepID=A0AAD5RTU9_9PEZI|nr:hypothetical protein MKZ38_010605 [Zalerion maritima]